MGHLVVTDSRGLGNGVVLICSLDALCHEFIPGIDRNGVGLVPIHLFLGEGMFEPCLREPFRVGLLTIQTHVVAHYGKRHALGILHVEAQHDVVRDAGIGRYGLVSLTVERVEVRLSRIAYVAVHGHHLLARLHVIAVDDEAVSGTALYLHRRFHSHGVPLARLYGLDTLLSHQLTVLIDEEGIGSIGQGIEAAGSDAVALIVLEHGTGIVVGKLNHVVAVGHVDGNLTGCLAGV